MEFWIYDYTGNKKVPVTLQVGDKINWKKNGISGSFEGTVIKVFPKCIRAEIVSHDGVKLTPFECNIKTGIKSAYRNGERLQ